MPGYWNFCSVSSAAGIPETRSIVTVAISGMLPDVESVVVDVDLTHEQPDRRTRPAYSNGLLYFDILRPRQNNQPGLENHGFRPGPETLRNGNFWVLADASKIEFPRNSLAKK